ncbi:hypothetical protein BJ165DRAFT_1528628 [Panaeolus papilionaceus]|nr:hypothetical protein BJ165DRAFT_1528628 [Panaeolus papilionaceus]
MQLPKTRIATPSVNPDCQSVPRTTHGTAQPSSRASTALEDVGPRQRRSEQGEERRIGGNESQERKSRGQERKSRGQERKSRGQETNASGETRQPSSPTEQESPVFKVMIFNSTVTFIHSQTNNGQPRPPSSEAES